MIKASFASDVLALKARNASTKDSVLALLKLLFDAVAEESFCSPFVEVVAVEVGALKSPVQSVGRPLVAGDVGFGSDFSI